MVDPLLAVSCTDRERRLQVGDTSSTHNGIDWLDVDPADQKVLHVGFLHPLPGQPGGVPTDPELTKVNVTVTGGERVRGIAVLSAVSAGSELTVTVDRAGDFSPYTLRIVRSGVDDRAPDGFDPVLSATRFSFKANCDSDLDCATPEPGPARTVAETDLDHLAKDYDGFRRLMLDRLSAQLPAWTERNPADSLVTLVEALAHVADRLSYRQDAAATEAYLGTARSRVSVRRHARLLDYRVHDGCTARTWLSVQVVAGSPAEMTGVPAGTLALSWPGAGATVTEDDVDAAVGEGAVVFQTLETLDARAALNSIPMHTWSGVSCRLPRGSTRATLLDEPARGLAVGNLLLLEEVRSPVTGTAADADPAHRHVVRLTSVRSRPDPVEGVTVVDVEWGIADALPFDLVITSTVPGDGIGAAAVCAVARGNVVLAHNARPMRTELPRVGTEPRWRPQLGSRLLASVAPSADDVPASAALRQDPRRALPDVRLTSGDALWLPQPDLLASDRFDRSFAVELEADGRSWLRFGDDVHGRAPSAGTDFVASWSEMLGAAGNVGAGVLTTLVTDAAGIDTVTNPLPALGGTDPEPMVQVKQFAPTAFVTQERAVTPTDWVVAAKRNPEVQDAAAHLRWTGSWWTVFLTLDLLGGRRLAQETVLAKRLHSTLDRFRIAGYDLELRDPIDVPVSLGMWVCVSPGVFRADVLEALLDAFAHHDTATGRGFFHPDNFSFGQPLYLSAVISRAMRVPGVRSVTVTELHPVGVLPGDEIDDGVLAVGPLEVVRLDNDPSVPEHGVLIFDLDGGL